MEQQDASVLRGDSPALGGSYLRLILSVLVGAALGLGIYFLLTSKNQTPTNTADRLCVCPGCGMTIPKPTGLDCEEVNCPNCGHGMNSAARLAAAAANPGGASGAGTMTLNQRETLAEQGTATQPKPPGVAAPQPAAFAYTLPLRDESKCVCPNCGKTTDRQPGVPCSHVWCPNCQSLMTNSIPIGRQQDMRLVGMGGTGNHPGGAAPCPGAGGGVAAPCPGTGGGGTAPCPGAGVGAAPPCAPGANVPQAGTQTITYSNTIKGIVERNCLRCHGGPIRTLNTCDQVKAYANNGLLKMMTQPGGPMSRFLTADESHQISAWIKAGSPP